MLFLLLGLAGLALVAGQNIDAVAVEAAGLATISGPPLVPTATSAAPTYNPSVVAAAASASAVADPIVDYSTNVTANAMQKRTRRRRSDLISNVTACSNASSLSIGYGPASDPDTASAFLVNPAIQSAAINAYTPNGYTVATGYTNLKGSSQQAGYMGYYLLKSYDTIKCAQYCDAAIGCMAFNMYFERDPTVTPAFLCSNPPSTVKIICALYNLPVEASSATNTGQVRVSFHIAVAGSNGYLSVAPPDAQPEFTGPSARLPGAIDAPLYQGKDTFLGSRFFPGPYEPAQCALVCLATTAFDMANPVNGTYKPCNFFNSYILSSVANGPLGTYCSFYTMPWSRGYAIIYGTLDAQGNSLDVSESYTYTLTVQDSGKINSCT